MTGAAIPPAVIADAVVVAKGWLRAPATGGDAADDAAVAALCATAIALAEAYCGRVLIARGWHEVVSVGSDWRPLGAAPVGAITALVDAGGATVPAAGYAVDIDADGVGWLRSTVGTMRVAVDYGAGDAATWSAVPAPIAQGIAMLVAHLFDDRDGVATPPAAVAALWRPFRRLHLASPVHGERRA